ncbi:MAG: hypothetical protein Q8935_14915 [Bacillota bacterium]|jgi:hypothetical protein|nr:hypothetical protein [Bacillota bacterium]
MEKKTKILNDSLYEGRDKAFMDIDRMMNEGLAGGSVHNREGAKNIEEAHDFHAEQPPNKLD